MQSLESLRPLVSIIFIKSFKILSGLSPLKFFINFITSLKLGGTRTFSKVMYEGRLYWGKLLSLPISTSVENGSLLNRFFIPSLTRLVKGSLYPFGNIGILSSLHENINFPLRPLFTLSLRDFNTLD